MMEEVINYAKEKLELKKITLIVLEGNDSATNLYKKRGFTEYGRLPEASFYKDRLIDEIMMYRDL